MNFLLYTLVLISMCCVILYTDYIVNKKKGNH